MVKKMQMNRNNHFVHWNNPQHLKSKVRQKASDYSSLTGVLPQCSSLRREDATAVPWHDN
jgi:hypothetical protein